jgi:transcriptional regulatory protein LEU3
LFWVIIFAAARRYCTNQAFFNDLTEHVQKELVTCVSNPAMGVEGIHAALIICAWPLPTIRFVTDPSTGFAGLAANASILSGFHSGKGSHPQFCFASRGHVSATDEEASSTHLATCFISQW